MRYIKIFGIIGFYYLIISVPLIVFTLILMTNINAYEIKYLDLAIEILPYVAINTIIMSGSIFRSWKISLIRN
jgi:hypothetical protein